MKKILIADSNKASLVMTSEVFKDSYPGIQVLVAKTSVEAFETAKSNKDIDAYIVDFDLPDANGASTALKLKKLSDKPILITAFERPDVTDSIRTQLPQYPDCQSWLKKPVNSDIVVAVAQRFCEGKIRGQQRVSCSIPALAKISVQVEEREEVQERKEEVLQTAVKIDKVVKQPARPLAKDNATSKGKTSGDAKSVGKAGNSAAAEGAGVGAKGVGKAGNSATATGAKSDRGYKASTQSNAKVTKQAEETKIVSKKSTKSASSAAAATNKKSAASSKAQTKNSAKTAASSKAQTKSSTKAAASSTKTQAKGSAKAAASSKPQSKNSTKAAASGKKSPSTSAQKSSTAAQSAKAGKGSGSKSSESKKVSLGGRHRARVKAHAEKVVAKKVRFRTVELELPVLVEDISLTGAKISLQKLDKKATTAWKTLLESITGIQEGSSLKLFLPPLSDMGSTLPTLERHVENCHLLSPAAQKQLAENKRIQILDGKVVWMNAKSGICCFGVEFEEHVASKNNFEILLLKQTKQKQTLTAPLLRMGSRG